MLYPVRMKTRSLHRWDLPPKEAVKTQSKLRNLVVERGTVKNIRLIAGADVSVSADRLMMNAAVSLHSYPDLKPLEQVTQKGIPTFPYVPGLLSFREGPLLIDCFKKLKRKPDVIIFDGQGIAHPRRFGIAAHLGVLLDIPSIGCAKSPLYGEYDTPGNEKGSFSYIKEKDGRIIGACLRSRSGVKPIFVSVGHKLSLKQAVDTVLECTPRYRLPEPIRAAHNLAGPLGGSARPTAYCAKRETTS